jgi:hypothetical protein
MRARSLHPVLCCVLLLAACGSDRLSGEELPLELPPPPAPPPAPVSESIYDEAGELLASERLIAGLAVPQGSTTVLDEERRHIFRSAAPLAKVQRYFGVRLITGAVDSLAGGGVAYRAATPRDARGSTVQLDVVVEPSSSSQARIEIIELPPAIVNPPSQEETLRRLAADLERAE